ncbi:YybH family protein [Pseudomonas sp. PB3P13]
MSDNSVVNALDELLNGYRTNEQYPYFKCFADNATVLLHTSSEVFFSKADFERAWLRLREEHGFKVIDCQSSNCHVTMGDGFAVIIHDVYTSFLYDGEVVLASDRETIVFRRDNAEGLWLVCHEHLSPMPPLVSAD